MARKNRKNWVACELIEILTYLDDNFDSWYESPHAAYIKAIQATESSRCAKSVHSKVVAMVKAMDNFDKTGERTCEILWEDEEIYDMVSKLCTKYKERMKKEKEEKEAPRKRRKKKEKEEKEAPRKRRKKNVRFETDTNDIGCVEPIDQKTPGTSPITSMNGSFSIEAFDSFCNRKIEEFQRGYQQVHSLCGEISQLESELKRKIDARKCQVEKLTEFRFLSE